MPPLEPIFQGTGATLADLTGVAQQFTLQGRVLDVRPYGNGNVHDTFLVTVQGAAQPHFILQRLNPRVFRRPELVMANLRPCTEHVRRRLARAPLDGRPPLGGAPGAADPGRPGLFHRSGGAFWRALSFIEAAQTFETINDPEHAREVGYGPGPLPPAPERSAPGRLSDTLPGFHVTPGYLAHYDEVLGRQGAPPSPEVSLWPAVYRGRAGPGPRSWRRPGPRAGSALRPIHGDPKVNNVLLDTATGQAVALVDLDTVKPGLVHYDIGDCLRSGCNPLGEETEHWEAVRFDPDLGRALLQGIWPWPGTSSPTTTITICTTPSASSPSNWDCAFSPTIWPATSTSRPGTRNTIWPGPWSNSSSPRVSKPRKPPSRAIIRDLR